MPQFSYIAMDVNGRKQKGKISATSQKQAQQLLKEKSLFPTQLVETKNVQSRLKIRGSFLFKQSYGKVRIAPLSRQLGTLLHAGLTLEESLVTMIGEGREDETSTVLSQILESLYGGMDLATALEKFPQIFSPTFTTMVRAGEESGTLDIVMMHLADLSESQEELRRKVKGALTYPFIVAFVGLLVVIFLLTVIVPQVSQIFLDADRVLPLPTAVLLFVSSFVSSYWLGILIGAGALTFLLKKIYQTSQGKNSIQGWLLMSPLVGDIYRHYIVGQTCQVLSLLLENGVNLPKAIVIVQKLSSNVMLRKALSEMHEGVNGGKAMSAFLVNKLLFSYTIGQMIRAGERSNSLAHMLSIVGKDCKTQLQSKIQAATSMIEPVMILILGSIVGFVVMAIFLPIMRMNSLVG